MKRAPSPPPTLEIVPVSAPQGQELAAGQVSESARKYVRQARAKNTTLAYDAAWKEFTAFCKQHPCNDPVVAVANFITALADAGAKVNTISLKLAGISAAFRATRQFDPTGDVAIKELMKGIRRTLGTRPNKKAPLNTPDLRRVVAVAGDDLRGKRDAALLLLGFSGAFRRSELAALAVEDLRFALDSLHVLLTRSKTDQEGKGMMKVIPVVGGDICPVAALRAWLDAAGISSGPVFREIGRWGSVGANGISGPSVAKIVKRLAKLAGLDYRQFSGHSLRSGFVTSAHLAGQSLSGIMEVTGHRSMDTALGYIQDMGVGGQQAIKAVMK